MSGRENEAVPAVRLSLLTAPPFFVALSIWLQLVALLGAVVELVRWPGDLETWAGGGLLVALALGFDEIARRTARLRIRLSEQLRTDMTSVWAIAASAALPRGVAVVVLAVILTYDWFRHHRPAGESLHRKAYVLATIVIGVLAASTISHAVLGDVVQTIYGSGAPALPTTATVLVAIVVYTVVQRALVTAGLVTMGVHGRVLLGRRDDNLIELATLCLGGLVALALCYQPLLAVLALVPMVTLHRGALIRELETAASIDAKTGLLNAVAWEYLAQRELARAGRDDGTLAVLIIDIDHFKLVNDEHGHLVGDMVLRGIGHELVSVMREYDSAGRFGGEEFVVVLPDAPPAVALAIAERIRLRINAVTVADLAAGVVVDSPMSPLAVSVGVALFREHGTELMELLQAADAALYRAKAGGRNRVVLADNGVDGAPRESVSV